jgi:polyisoprenoid-binding protein YceI
LLEQTAEKTPFLEVEPCPTKHYVRFSILSIAVLALSACGGTSVPEATSTPAAAAPTAEPAPSDAPTPTATPAPADSPKQSEPAADTESSPLPTLEALLQALRAFDIEAANTEVHYEAKEEFFNGAVERMGKVLGFFNAVGTTNAIEGGFVFSAGNPPQIETSQFEVDLTTLTSDDIRRDRRVNEKFLETGQYPLAEFRATGIEDMSQDYVEGEETSFKPVGDMTIHGTTQPASWDVSATLEGNSLTGTAQTVVMLVDYGIAVPDIPSILTVTDGITVNVDFTATESSL